MSERFPKGTARLMTHMTVKDMQDILQETQTVLIAIGGTEQHGWHLPLSTDALIAEYIVRRVSEETGSVVAPVINYSHSYGTLLGTTNISYWTLRQLLAEVIHSLCKQGFKKVIVIPVHLEVSTLHAAEDAVKLCQQNTHGATVVCYADHAPTEEAEQARPAQDGHAGTGETSYMLHIAPELVRDERPWDPAERWWLDAVTEIHGVQEWWTKDRPEMRRMDPDRVMALVEKAREEGGHPPIKYGVFGDPDKASAEMGEVLIEAYVGRVTEFVRKVEAGEVA